jgi:hypothetical protein
MGFLEKFFRKRAVTAPERKSSFDGVPEADLERFLAVNHYGGFDLTEAIRPSYDLKVVPRQGYRHDYWRSDEGCRVPVLMAAVTREKLFEVFMDLLDPLDATVDVVLETSHARRHGHADLYREHIDMPVLQSILWEFEDLLRNDGCTGIAVLNPRAPHEIQFDEHKLLIVYAHQLDAFEAVLAQHRIDCHEKIQFVTEAEHVHSSSDTYERAFEDLSVRLGMDHRSDDDQATF